MTSDPTGVMLLTRRQPDSPATALNKFCSICTPNGVYTEFGIDPRFEYERIVVALTQRIEHDAPVTEIQNSAQIKLMDLHTLIPFELCHISKPLLIGLVSVKLAAQQVFGKILRILGPSGVAMVIVFHSRPYVFGPADAQHSLVIDIDTIIMAQIIIQSPVAFIWAFRMDFFNLVR